MNCNGHVNESLSFIAFCSSINYDTNVKFTMTERANWFSYPSSRVMCRCDVVICVVLAAMLVSQVHPDCFSNVTATEMYRESFCNLPKNTGSCKLKWKRFYFNRVTRHCEQFIYEGNYPTIAALCRRSHESFFSSPLGCTSNRNNFKTEADCVACCLSWVTNEAIFPNTNLLRTQKTVPSSYFTHTHWKRRKELKPPTLFYDRDSFLL